MAVVLYEHGPFPPRAPKDDVGRLLIAFWRDGLVIFEDEPTGKLRTGRVNPKTVAELLDRLAGCGFWKTRLTRSVHDNRFDTSITIVRGESARTLHWDRVDNVEAAAPVYKEGEAHVISTFKQARNVIRSFLPAISKARAEPERLHQIETFMAHDARRQLHQMVLLSPPPSGIGQLRDFARLTDRNLEVTISDDPLILQGDKLSGSFHIRNLSTTPRFYLPFEARWLQLKSKRVQGITIWQGIRIDCKCPTADRYGEMEQLDPGASKVIEFSVKIPGDLPETIEVRIGQYYPHPGYHGRPRGISKTTICASQEENGSRHVEWLEEFHDPRLDYLRRW